MELKALLVFSAALAPRGLLAGSPADRRGVLFEPFQKGLADQAVVLQVLPGVLVAARHRPHLLSTRNIQIIPLFQYMSPEVLCML